MNTNDSSNFTLFQDRNLNDTTLPSRKPTRFSSEPEGEWMEMCLRALLVACLVAAMVVSGVRLDGIAKAHNSLPTLPDVHTEVAVAQPAAVPAAKAL